jgi:hypothetical protein
MTLLELQFTGLLFKGEECVNLEKYAHQDLYQRHLARQVSTVKISLQEFQQARVKEVISVGQVK